MEPCQWKLKRVRLQSRSNTLSFSWTFHTGLPTLPQWTRSTKQMPKKLTCPLLGCMLCEGGHKPHARKTVKTNHEKRNDSKPMNSAYLLPTGRGIWSKSYYVSPKYCQEQLGIQKNMHTRTGSTALNETEQSPWRPSKALHQYLTSEQDPPRSASSTMMASVWHSKVLIGKAWKDMKSLWWLD